MNPAAEDFTDGYYSDLCYATSAAVDGLKEIGDYETSGDSAIRDLFIFTTVAYLSDCPKRLSDRLVDFAVDVYYYLNDELSHLIEESSLGEKRQYLQGVRTMLDEASPSGKFLFDNLKGIILCAIRFCEIGDESARRSLAGALTRFVYLLINIDGDADDGGRLFYKQVKETLLLDINAPGIEQHLSGLIGNVDETESESVNESSKEELVEEGIDSNERSIDQLVNDVNTLIGLDSIKVEVLELVNMLRVQQMRLAAGLPKPDITNHMVFYGNPGTGKTTIARKLGEIYKSLNLLSRGHFVETDRAGLVAGYLGQTALKTREVLESAKGGILFIDEAYTLSPPNDQDLFGQEAIDTILKYMEDNRDDIVIIVAGYQDRMERFIQSNPGLKSRFGKYFYFPDYSAHELSQIFRDIAKKSSYSFGFGFLEQLDSVCNVIFSSRGDNFGNGRVMRNLFDRCIASHANRVIQIPNATSSQLMELLPVDLYDCDLQSLM